MADTSYPADQRDPVGARDLVTVTCAGCGASVHASPLSGSRQTSAGGADYLCDRCTREHLRSIEARLDEAWW